jgi:glucose-6-phosphate 1-dehydrogenase
MAEDFGVQGRGAFYDETGTIRDVVQNHLFQVLSNLAMEPPIRTDCESIRDEKVKVLKAVRDLTVDDVVRGQFRGFRAEPGVAATSQIETFVALRLWIDSWRWQGVPFYIRAGKHLPVTSTEIVVRLRKPPTVFREISSAPNYVRCRINPDITIAIGTNVIAPGQERHSTIAEMIATQVSRAGERGAYERVLGDAMHGDATLFAREDYVEEAWRIVDPILKNGPPVFEYEPGTWGPRETDAQVSPPGGWHNPTLAAAPEKPALKLRAS